MKKISVCMATYNGEKYIKEQIYSILIQLSFGDELIISDDHSTDNTVEIIKKFSDSRIKLYLNNEKGYTSNFENAIKHVTGDIVFLSDQDDVWVDNKVEVCLEHLKSSHLIVSDCKIINGNNELIHESYYDLRNIKKTFLGNIIKFSFLGCCLVFRSDILKKALPFPPNREYCTHDNWLFLVGSSFFKHKVLSDKLILYRRHENNVSSGGLSTNNKLWFKIKYRSYVSFYLIQRFFKKK